ncbi:MAG: 23S rRNA (guanosine(2251)-2'-O)-methyltransferase RlmB, partial [Lachnospiraceae bacterium]|nr:23S rRNA (guanosine(2251)-2'-O)-methyltransferase RlmB [Lachnospiraceae bacterium]
IRIPMEGQVESLNAGVAASLLMYEAYRQKRNS